jgi:hypothetical protein
MTFQHTVDELEGRVGQDESLPLHRRKAGRQQRVLWADKAKRWAINLFIGFHLVGITCWVTR